MSNYTALLDTNVLYPAPMRGLVMQLAVTGLFKARWSAEFTAILSKPCCGKGLTVHALRWSELET